jgi:cytochrome c oxidase assembly protein Cox11
MPTNKSSNTQMTKSAKTIIVLLVLILISYVAVYLYKQFEHLTTFDTPPIKLSEIKDIDPDASLNIFVREKDFLLTYKNNEETVTTTEDILDKYNTLKEADPELTVTYEAQKDLEFLRVMIPFSDLSVIPAGKMKVNNIKPPTKNN